MFALPLVFETCRVLCIKQDRSIADTILTKKGVHGHQAHNMHPLSLITDGQHFMRKQRLFLSTSQQTFTQCSKKKMSMADLHCISGWTKIQNRLRTCIYVTIHREYINLKKICNHNKKNRCIMHFNCYRKYVIKEDETRDYFYTI